MFGKNLTYTPKDFENEEKLHIKEIFYTIQGEGIFSGMPSCFIRLGKCCIKCLFCDTDFESDLVNLSVEEIIEKINEVTPENCRLIVITGGEPLLQNKICDLINELLLLGYIVQIETAGIYFPPNLPVDDDHLYIICSPKTGKIANGLEPHIDAFKYIISHDNYSEDDGLPIYSTQIENTIQKLYRPTEHSNSVIYISPMDCYDEEVNKLNLKAVTKIALQFNYTISLQIHKILNLP